MSLAIAYAMKRKADRKKMSHGGYCAEGCEMLHEHKYMPEHMAEGGYLEEEKESGYEPMPREKPEHMYEHKEENQEFPEEEHDLVSRIMKQRSMKYSKGGRVANDTPMEADFEDNDFDALPKEDDLEFHDTGANSGDEIGDKQEDEDRHDIVSRIMKSRKKKDRMPHPA